jgi:tRNA(Ile2) C34 agmatinyltransferase TiaS
VMSRSYWCPKKCGKRVSVVRGKNIHYKCSVCGYTCSRFELLELVYGSEKVLN